MLDIHCHILPGVDDGAEDLDESLAMFRAAQAAGITEIVCTPHCRDPYFDYEAMAAAYTRLRGAVGDFPLRMGFEVNHRKLMELGLDWARVLALWGTNTLLLELSVGASPSRFGVYGRTVFALQGMGYDVIIAHPERYQVIQRDIGYAEEFVRMGCKLQLSADFVAGGRFGGEKRPAVKLLKAGLVSYIASDAHCPEHYRFFAKAMDKYGEYLVG